MIRSLWIGYGLLLLSALAKPQDIRLRVSQQAIFAGQELFIQIHVTYAEGDDRIWVLWEPDEVGDSEWPIHPERSTYLLSRRLTRPGEYLIRVAVGRGEKRFRSVATARITVIGEN